MKIALLSNSFSANGGVGKYVTGLAREFLKAGHQPVVIHNDPSVREGSQGFPCYRVPDFDVFEGVRQNEKTAEVLNLLKKEKPGMVHIQANTNFFLEEEIRKSFPAVKTLHVFDFCPAGTKYHHALHKPCFHATGPMCLPRMLYKRCTESLRPSTLSMFYRRAIASNKNDSGYSKIIVASEYVKNQACASGYDKACLEVIPYFTEIRMPGPGTQCEKIIMATGRAVPEKGLDRLLFAVKELSGIEGWKLIIDSDGPGLAKLKTLARKLDLTGRVEFTGWLPPDQHETLYQKSSVVAVSSVWPEPFGLVGIEAMSYGKPVVAFAVGGIPDWLKNGETGFLVEPENIKKFAEKLKFLIQNPDQAFRMGMSGFEACQRLFSAKKHLQKLFSVYEGSINVFSNRVKNNG
jgi:glycosyltransferase involved in cell wall biosynthesis